MAGTQFPNTRLVYLNQRGYSACKFLNIRKIHIENFQNKLNTGLSANTMKISLQIILLLSLLACSTAPKKVIQDKDYEIHFADNQRAVLVLFPCFSCDIEHTRREAFFLQGINEAGVTTILLNIHEKLFLREHERDSLSRQLADIFERHHIDGKKVYIGGFSSGGNLALLMGDYMSQQKTVVNIQGVLSVDAPLDLAQLFRNAQHNISLNADAGTVMEGKMLVELLERELGTPEKNLENYIQYSPFVAGQPLMPNLQHHRDYKIRLYTEPALEWQMTQRKRTYDHTNSWMNEQLFQTLTGLGSQTCEWIKTDNKGVRSNGQVNPHSWSIVDQPSLLEWMQ